MSQNSKVKPVDILKILDLAKSARKLGKTFNPCFAGEAGLGKSEIAQLWVAQQKQRNPKFGFLDLRLAYMEAPDLIGLPRICSETNITRHVMPEFWPREGEGLILFEEPNRANSSVMNTMMQILTDRKVHNYQVPEGWVIASCLNPDNANYDVNAMDTALRDRFEIYNVTYDHKSFLDFIKESKWHPSIIAFIQSGLWVYKTPDELGDQGKYISPRTLSKLNNALVSGLDNYDEIYYSTVTSALGVHVGREFYKFVKNVRPLTAHDFIDDRKDAFKRLEKFCEGKEYKGDIVAILIDSLVDNFKKVKEIDIPLIAEISMIINKDQVYQLIYGCIKNSDHKLEDFLKVEPKLKTALQNSLRG